MRPDAFLRFRLPLILLVNLCLCTVGYWLAIATRFEFDFNDTFRSQFILPLLLLLCFRNATYLYWGLNEGYWRYTSSRDVYTLVKGHAVSSLAFAASIFLLRVENFPRSVIFFEFVLSLMISFGLRMLVRSAAERFIGSPSKQRSLGREVIVLGAGDSGHLLVKTLLSQRRFGYQTVAVLDDSEYLQGVSVYGVRVVGHLEDLPIILHQFPRVSAVIVAIPSLSEARFEALRAQAAEFSVAVKRLQSFEDIACLDAEDPHAQPSIEAVLDKSVLIEHEAEVRAAVGGSAVLITGAGGSIGSEIVRQVTQFGPKKLILLDNCEYNLFKIEQELSRLYPSLAAHYFLGNICDEARLVTLFNEHQPDLVLHAAAFKHVPLLESNCYQAFLNNIIGTRNLLRLSLHAGVKRFVLISSDKAVDPSSVMGASKRVAELLTIQACRQAAETGNRLFSAAAVRFGNVINSTGSVIPMFREQIASGGPLTVTHPDMERYFMSIKEAVSLVLTAGALAQSGEVYLLNMGKPIKIVDVARKMLALYGRRDIPIIFTGVRPGEKLSESLTQSTERRVSTRFAKVSRVVPDGAPLQDAMAWVMSIERDLSRKSDNEIGVLIKDFVQSDSSSRLAAHARESQTA
jgi:FlaA1/EpsC-like NDP-sugar epimerase